MVENGTTIRAHILDPNRGYYSEDWIVGDDISKKDAQNFVTSSSDIYVAVAYEKGEPNIMITTKEVWYMQRSIFEMIDRGEDYEVALDSHLSDLKRKSE